MNLWNLCKSVAREKCQCYVQLTGHDVKFCNCFKYFIDQLTSFRFGLHLHMAFWRLTGDLDLVQRQTCEKKVLCRKLCGKFRDFAWQHVSSHRSNVRTTKIYFFPTVFYSFAWLFCSTHNQCMLLSFQKHHFPQNGMASDPSFICLGVSMANRRPWPWFVRSMARVQIP